MPYYRPKSKTASITETKPVAKSTDIKSKNTDTRTMTIFNHTTNYTTKYKLPLYQHINILNSIISSKNAMDICRSLNIYDIELTSNALVYSLTHKTVFSGDNSSTCAKDILRMLNCSVKPVYNETMFSVFSYIKWKIYENTQKPQVDNEIAEWIGILSGLMLYFDNIDENNFNQTHFLEDACAPFIVQDF